ncbi:MAG: hypothetical protein IJ223_03865 [Clostridia bacterium]|nr:hypothetical protein [Clostridia bacterium]
MKKINSIQKWLPFQKILDNGIIMLKDYSYIKILKITPINYNLKSNLEKEAILNSYKLFLKTCNFDIQILIQNTKKDLSQNISKINKNNYQNKKIKKISEEYINYIQTLNNNKNVSSKNYFILIKNSQENKKEKLNLEKEKIIINKLNEKYFKIKECLNRCGNNVMEINNKKELIEILYNFYYI